MDKMKVRLGKLKSKGVVKGKQTVTIAAKMSSLLLTNRSHANA